MALDVKVILIFEEWPVPLAGYYDLTRVRAALKFV